MKHAKRMVLRSALALAMVGTFTACEDFSLCGLTEEDLGMGDAFIETTSYFMNIVNRADEAMRDETLQVNGSTTIDGATVRLTNDSLIIDFGPNNVATADGKLRRGKIAGAVTGDYFAEAGSISIQLQGYHVDDVAITGDLTVTNNGNNNGVDPWEIALVSPNFAMGNLYTYDANLSMEWTSGFETDTINEDDVFTISGMASGSDLQDTISFETAFTEPMQFERACEYLVTGGIVDVSLTDGEAEVAAVEVDFIGNDGPDADGCNNVVMLNASCDGTTVSFPQNFDGF